MNFSSKRTVEQEVFTVDFAALLATGEAITSFVWAVSVYNGIDAMPASMIHGGATLTGTKVSQMLKGGVPGVTYAPICTVMTSSGQTLVLPETETGLLRVTE